MALLYFVAARWSMNYCSPADADSIKATCCLETALGYWHQNKEDVSAKATIQKQMNCPGFDFYKTRPIPYPPIVSVFHVVTNFSLAMGYY